MNDLPENSHSEHLHSEENVWHEPPEEEPQFGVVDLVEAFTAMRHEWRGQTRESRELADHIQTVVANLEDLETRLMACVMENRADEAKALAILITETDHQLTRAVTAVEQADQHRRQQDAAKLQAIEDRISTMSSLARWLAGPLIETVRNQFAGELSTADQEPPANPTLEGLNLLLARLRRSMKELQITRIETLGEPFDAKLMNAIGTLETSEFPSGYVAEQLSPCYYWQGELLQFADVRVAS